MLVYYPEELLITLNAANGISSVTVNHARCGGFKVTVSGEAPAPKGFTMKRDSFEHRVYVNKTNPDYKVSQANMRKLVKSLQDDPDSPVVVISASGAAAGPAVIPCLRSRWSRGRSPASRT
jgi:hypothetical protein